MLLRKRVKHEIGDKVFYACRYTHAGRVGVVKHIIPHYSLTYYVLEVETYIDPFLKMLSEFQINKENVYGEEE
jgi:hypothetical protein